MSAAADRKVEYFSTYETREEAFRRRVNDLIPRKYGGPSLFWEDFGQITFERAAGEGRRHAYITSNPRDCLAYATPEQVLGAAAMQARASGGVAPQTVETVAQAFDIRAILTQPIRSLSGGETVKLALAKSFVAAGHSRRLTIASPFSWLSANNRFYFEQLCTTYGDLGLPVEILALEGEDSTEPIGDSDAFNRSAGRSVEFSLSLAAVRIPLGTLLSDIQGQNAQAAIADFRTRLCSPCLLVGENGQGKSLVAKTLAGAMAHGGNARIGTGAFGGRVRLLFQDVVTQTLLRPFENLAPAAGCAQAVYDRIIGDVSRAFAARGLAPPLESRARFRSLLEIKAMLIAARLAVPPSALILDEPDWGLTRSASAALVSATIEAAHEGGTPVILISHKPWWRSVAASRLQVERSETAADGSFEIFVSEHAGPCV